MLAKVGVTPAARLMRGILCAALAVFLAGASHAVAGGIVPVFAVLVSFPLGALVCVILAGRQLSLSRVVAGVAVSQVVFHFLFDLFAVIPSSVVARAGHQHEFVSAPPLSPMMAGATTSFGDMDTAMVTSHLVAGLVTIALVRHGEHLWWSLVGAVRSSVTTILGLVRLYPVALEDRRSVVEYTPHGLQELLQSDSRRRLRGPPVRRVSIF